MYRIMKTKKTLQGTTDSKAYKRAVKEKSLNCQICSPHRGCNRNRDYDNSWKSNRKHQWR